MIKESQQSWMSGLNVRLRLGIASRGNELPRNELPRNELPRNELRGYELPRNELRDNERRRTKVQNDTHKSPKRRGGSLRSVVLFACLSSVSLVHAISEETPVDAQTNQVSVPLSAATDQQIGALLQRWLLLDAAQRRDLLAEVRKRMNLAKIAANNKNVTNIRGLTPSLTVRIKGAQIQRRYGSSAAAQDDQKQGVQEQGVQEQGVQEQPTQKESVNSAVSQAASGTDLRKVTKPRDVVIRTTVTQILPDGSRLIREETLLPQVSKQASNTVRSGAAEPADQGAMRNNGEVRVIRTTVRFGAGFDQRTRPVIPVLDEPSRMRRVSTAKEPSKVSTDLEQREHD